VHLQVCLPALINFNMLEPLTPASEEIPASVHDLELASLQSTADSDQADDDQEHDLEGSIAEDSVNRFTGTVAENHTTYNTDEDLHLFRRQRKLRKKIREITCLEAKASEPCLMTSEVQEKLAKRGNFESEIEQLEQLSLERLHLALECRDTLTALGNEHFAQLSSNGSTISFCSLQTQARSLVNKMGFLPREPPSDLETYALMTVCSGSHRLALDADEFQEFLREFIRSLLAENGFSNTSQRMTMLEPVPPVGIIRLTILTMSGEAMQITVDDSDTIETLHESVKANFDIRHSEQRLICNGFILQNAKALYEHGITNDDVVLLVRVFEPPHSIKVTGHRWRGDVSGTYSLVSKDPDGRPVYNCGSYWLVHERTRGRWAINDQLQWDTFVDRAYAYCESTANDPCEPSSESWRLWAGGRTFQPCSGFSLRPGES